ncbi:MAG: hypothetical protein JNK82_44015 [Myxococcaceae bacterium]|nr:hypothetical protein [Myxococcaceae bacterium]
MLSTFTNITPIEEMRGDDEEDTALLQETFPTAENHLSDFRWCLGIRRSFFGIGVGGIVGVFLFELDPAPEADSWVWVIAGDIPRAYLEADAGKNPTEALSIYCHLMMDWVEAVESGGVLDDVFPVNAPPTAEAAAMLRSRVASLREIFELDGAPQ